MPNNTNRFWSMVGARVAQMMRSAFRKWPFISPAVGSRDSLHSPPPPPVPPTNLIHESIEEERLPGDRLKYFHPTRRDEVLDGRFKTIVKLGYGAGSTVWLAENLELCAAPPPNLRRANPSDVLTITTARDGGRHRALATSASRSRLLTHRRVASLSRLATMLTPRTRVCHPSGCR